MSFRNYSAREPSWDLTEIASVQDDCPSTIDSPNLKRKRENIYAKLDQLEKEEERERKKARKTPKSFIELLRLKNQNNLIVEDHQNSDSDSIIDDDDDHDDQDDQDDDDQDVYGYIHDDDVDDEESQGQCFENQFRYGYEEFDSEDNDDESDDYED